MKLLLTFLLFIGAPQAQWIGKAPTQTQRIVSLAPNLTELVFELGEGQRIVGVTRFDNYPPKVLQLPKVGGFINPNLEAIAAVKPDLVLATPNSGGKAQAKTLARLGIPVFSIPAQEWTHLSAAITNLSKLLNCPKKGEELIAKLKSQEIKLATQFSKLPKKRALVVLGLKPLVSAGPNSFIDRFLPLIRLENVVTKGGTYPILDEEALLSLKPHIVIDLGMANADASKTYWKSFPKTVDFRVHQTHDDALLRLGPRLFQALETLGAAVHTKGSP